MRQVISIGNFSIYVFGVTVALGILTGLWITIMEAKRKGVEVDKVFDTAIYTAIVALLGARLYYVIVFNPRYYIRHPKEIVMINNGGLSIQGALIAGILFAIWYTRKRGVDFWTAADTFAPGIAVGQSIGRIGCDVFGIPMVQPYIWGVMVNSRLLHPVQLYEAVLDLMLFIYLWRIRGRNRYSGELFIKYITGFAAIRAAVEFFRTNPVVFKPFTVVHVTSLVMIVVAVIADRLIKNRKGSTRPATHNCAVDKVSRKEYLAIFGGAIAGILFYYYIN